MNNTYQGMKPVANADDIIAVFENLVEANGTTTTLDVKRELRDQGFWITQSEVSDTLTEWVETVDEYDFTIDRNHRVYELATNAAPVLPSYVSTPKAVAKVADWKVTDGVDTQTYCDMTRNQARYLFSKQFDVPYISTKGTLA